MKLREIIAQLQARVEFLEEKLGPGEEEEEALEYGDILGGCLIDVRRSQERINGWN